MSRAANTCEKCGKTFRAPALLRRHKARKTPCIVFLEVKDLPDEVRDDPKYLERRCKFCGRVFSTKSAMGIHIKKHCKVAPNKRNGNDGMEVLYKHIVKQKELEAKLAVLEAKMESDGKLAVAPAGGNSTLAVQGNHNNTMVNSQNTVYNLQINAFGSEDTSHITRETMRTLLNNVVATRAEVGTAVKTAIYQAASHIFSNDERPENMSCFIPNKKHSSAMINTETGWDVTSVRDVLGKVANVAINQLFNKQPHDYADPYAPLLRELAANEPKYSDGMGMGMRTILERNKAVLSAILSSLPKVGKETPPARAKARPQPGVSSPPKNLPLPDCVDTVRAPDNSDDVPVNRRPPEAQKYEDEPISGPYFGKERLGATQVSAAVVESKGYDHRALQILIGERWGSGRTLRPGGAPGEVRVLRKSGKWELSSVLEVVSPLFDRVHASGAGDRLVKKQNQFMATVTDWFPERLVVC